MSKNKKQFIIITAILAILLIGGATYFGYTLTRGGNSEQKSQTDSGKDGAYHDGVGNGEKSSSEEESK